MQQHSVRMVGENDLPEGVDWAVARDPISGECVAIFKEGHITAEVLEGAWAAYRGLVAGRIPEPRRANLAVV